MSYAMQFKIIKKAENHNKEHVQNKYHWPYLNVMPALKANISSLKL